LTDHFPIKSDPSRSPINILAFIHFHRLINQTGVGRVTGELMSALASREDISLHALGNVDDHRTAELFGLESQTSIPAHLFNRSRKFQQAKWLVTGSPKAESYWPETDIVWCPAEAYVPTARAHLVVTVHDVAHLENGVRRWQPGISAQRTKWSLMFRRLKSEAAAFVTVSQFSASRLCHFYPWIRDRVWVVPNATPKRFLSPPSADGDSEVSELKLGGTPFVLVPGGLTFQKNGQLILAAWKQIRKKINGAMLVIAGRSEPDLATDCLNLGPEVRILGYVSDEAMRSLYAKAEVVWYPSRYEGFGLPILEAMASGKPVISCLTSAIPEVAGDAAVLLSVNSPEQHAEAILAFLKSPDMRKEWANKGLYQAQKFSWEGSANALVGVFHQVLRRYA
jgi:glycosyltransferase involved in cell wall biosynthesis